jgi:hypothetical protein
MAFLILANKLVSVDENGRIKERRRGHNSNSFRKVRCEAEVLFRTEGLRTLLE